MQCNSNETLKGVYCYPKIHTPKDLLLSDPEPTVPAATTPVNNANSQAAQEQNQNQLPLNGYTIVWAKHDHGGRYTYLGNYTWAEFSKEERVGTFEELGRDEWVIYLRTKAALNHKYILLNVAEKQVESYYQSANSSAIHRITQLYDGGGFKAPQPKLNGYSVTSIRHSNRGWFVKTGHREWTEYANGQALNRRYREVNRQERSIMLDGGPRGVEMKLDLQTNQISERRVYNQPFRPLPQTITEIHIFNRHAQDDSDYAWLKPEEDPVPTNQGETGNSQQADNLPDNQASHDHDTPYEQPQYDNNQQAHQQEETSDLDYYLRLANAGDVEAQAELGEMYFFGKGVYESKDDAFYWFQKAAHQGHPNSQYAVGYMYEVGVAVRQNVSEAIQWYFAAANQGEMNAQVSLGRFYEEGNGVRPSRLEATRWYRLSAEQGNAVAQQKLGHLLSIGGKGIEVDLVQAFDWMYRSAQQGDLVAQHLLARKYQTGQGVEQSYEEAIIWFERSALQGYAFAQNEVAHLIYAGWGTPQDFAAAAQWYLKAAKQGVDVSQHKIADMYYSGVGVRKDIRQARVWYRKAAAQGDKEAYKKLNKLLN